VAKEENDVRGLKKICKQLKKELNKATADLTDIKLKLLHTEIYLIELKCEKMNWENQQKELEENMTTLREKLHGLITVYQNACKDRDRTKKEYIELKEASTKLKMIENSQKVELENHILVLKQQEKQIDEQLSLQKELENERNILETEKNMLTQDLQSKDVELKKLELMYKNIQIELNEAKQSYKDLRSLQEKEIEDITIKNEEMKKQLENKDSLLFDYTNLKEKANQLETEYKRLKELNTIIVKAYDLRIKEMELQLECAKKEQENVVLSQQESIDYSSSKLDINMCSPETSQCKGLESENDKNLSVVTKNSHDENDRELQPVANEDSKSEGNELIFNTCSSKDLEKVVHSYIKPEQFHEPMKVQVNPDELKVHNKSRAVTSILKPNIRNIIKFQPKKKSSTSKNVEEDVNIGKIQELKSRPTYLKSSYDIAKSNQNKSTKKSTVKQVSKETMKTPATDIKSSEKNSRKIGLTASRPFSFEARNKNMQDKKHQKIQEYLKTPQWR